jgi:hypothetical protein
MRSTRGVVRKVRSRLRDRHASRTRIERQPLIRVFREQVVATASLLAQHIDAGGSWADVKLLTVTAGLLCIGDAAPTRVTQAMQVGIQNNLLVPALDNSGGELRVPLRLRVITSLPPLQRLLARVLGMGVRPEHVCSPAAPPQSV